MRAAAALLRLGRERPAPPTATAAPPPPQAVVFFHGDRVPGGAGPLAARLQQPAEVAAVLAAKFPRASVLVVMPPRYEDDFASYDGWLPGPLRQGVPARFGAGAFPAARALRDLLAAEGLAPGHGPTRQLQLVLVGFSKGAVVLHQVLAELAQWQRAAGQACAACAWQAHQQQQGGQAAAAGGAAAAAEGEAAAPGQVLAAIRELHWLDAGCSMRGAAYPASPSLFQALAARCADPAHAVRLHLHGTPRQWHDPARRWLGQEARAMAAAAAAAGVAVSEREYFAGQPPSLEQHFASIEALEV